MKKGASHVDWAIGTGLFVVFIMLTLIALRPGTEPIYKGDVLLKIIEDGLENDTYYTIEKQLLSIIPDVSCITNPCELRIRKATYYGLNPEWVKDESSIKKIAVLNSTGDVQDEYKPFDLYNEYCKDHSCSQDEKNVLDFKSHIESTGANAFWMLYSEDIDYKEIYENEIPPVKRAGLSWEGVNKNVEIFAKDESGLDAGPPTELLDKGPNNEYPNNNFTYKFGVSETMRGFSEEKLYSISNESTSYNYTAKKDEWNIPEDKNFRIRITNLTAYKPYKISEYENYGINFFNGKPEMEQIPAGVSVFVKEWSEWVLTPEGRFEPVRIHVELW